MNTAQPVENINTDKFRRKLKLNSYKLKNTFQEKYPHAAGFFQNRNFNIKQLRERSAKLLSAGALTGALLFSPPETTYLLPTPKEIVRDADNLLKNGEELIPDILEKVIPAIPRPLGRNEEKFLEQVLTDISGIRVRSTLEGEHLNTVFGLIGAEQHLKRYPGDSLTNHGQVLSAGIAPGLGAWGYFSPTGEKLTQSLTETEKWYAVVQTLYLPDWNKRHYYLRDWYKYRKVMIVNTNNGKTVIAAIADAGPAAWTGKQFGGSPEVMNFLGGTKYRKGPVLVFFVDDPDNKIPLGPVKYRTGITI